MPDRPILASSEDEQIIGLSITNIESDALANYTIEWTFIPAIGDGIDNFDSYTIPVGSLVYNQNYVVTVNIYHTYHPVLQNLVSYVFQTKAVPYGGTVQIEPEQVQFGQAVSATISGWTSSYSAIMWRLWSTTFPEGLEKNELINDEDWMPFNKIFVFSATSIYPLIFEIKDSGGEIVRITVQSNTVAPSANSIQLVTVLKSTVPQQVKLAYIQNSNYEN